MSDSTESDGVKMLQGFSDAWNDHDIDALMSFMTEDCIYDASAGPEVWGTRFEGYSSVREGYLKIWEVFPDAHWGNARHFVTGNHGVSEWTFTGTMKDGSRVEMHGCDIFVLRDGKIYTKDSFRKNRPPISS